MHRSGNNAFHLFDVCENVPLKTKVKQIIVTESLLEVWDMIRREIFTPFLYTAQVVIEITDKNLQFMVYNMKLV